MRGGYTSFNQSITGIKTATELKPALQVKQNRSLLGKGSLGAASALPKQLPPVERSMRQKSGIEQTPLKNMSMYQDQMDYEEYKYSTAAMVPSKFFAFNFIFSD